MLRVAVFVVLFGPLVGGAQTNLADGFSRLPSGASVVVMPADIELFEISAGGVTEPRADWTELAERHVYLMSYTAPRNYLYAKHLAQVQAFAASARITIRETEASASP